MYSSASNVFFQVSLAITRSANNILFTITSVNDVAVLSTTTRTLTLSITDYSTMVHSMKVSFVEYDP